MGFLDDLKKNLGFAEKGRHQDTAAQAPVDAPEPASAGAPEAEQAPAPADVPDAARADVPEAAQAPADAPDAARADAQADAGAVTSADTAAVEAAAEAAAAQEAAAVQAAAQVAAPVRRGQVTEVVVEPGDTLSGIAIQFGVDVDALLAANADTVPNPDLIYPGQVLRLP